jgi:hypothetical protein
MPESIGGSLYLSGLTSIPENFKMPESIGGYLYLRGGSYSLNQYKNRKKK